MKLIVFKIILSMHIANIVLIATLKAIYRIYGVYNNPIYSIVKNKNLLVFANIIST
jgi:hypothetical protein